MLTQMCKRALQRRAFNRSLAEFHTIQADIADSRIEIDAARQLVLKVSAMPE